MWKAVGVMFVATIIVSMGNGLLSKGMRELDDLQWSGPFWSVLLECITSAIHNPKIILGVACHATFFGLMLLAFSWGDLSLVLPVSAFTFVFGAVIAQFYLNEHVNALRWIGALIIMIGVMTVLAGEHWQESPSGRAAGLTHIRGFIGQPGGSGGSDGMVRG
jgi:drug/metabolite transporter (DMT)-like permease